MGTSEDGGLGSVEMPIPFRDADEVEALGAAGYLKIDASQDNSVFRGALFLINARGEPIEFAYNEVKIPSTFLWRQEDIRRHAARNLTTSLLAICRKVPQFIICLAAEVDHQLFCNEIHLSIPVGRIASPSRSTPHSQLEVQAAIGDPQQLHLFWFPGKPADESPENRLLNMLVTHGLLLEPFDRALVGLREAYPDQIGRDH